MEPIQQHSIASITDCQVQMAAHRKQGNVLPTLALQISPDPTTDKLRKRRSSRTAGLTTMRDSGPISLWFRLGEDQTYTLTEWADYIRSLMQPGVADFHKPVPPSAVRDMQIHPIFEWKYSPTVHFAAQNLESNLRVEHVRIKS